VSVEKLRIERFRCLGSVDIDPDPRQNVIVGENGAGKTSVLEAMFFLGRGRSFRPGYAATLIQDGAEAFTLFAEVCTGNVSRRLGVLQGAGVLKIQVDGESGGSVADLVGAFPVQVIEPEIHELVQGGPNGRRRFMDWGVFHVKHDFYPVWRRYRRALQQRNQALRQKMARKAVQAWDGELIAAATEIDELRKDYLERLEPHLEEVSQHLLGLIARGRYRSGWARDQQFAEALESSWERDASLGRTHAGPHRAELVLEVDGTPARNRLSRGQQKLLGISLVLAQTRLVAESLGSDVTLLVDEPAAELDASRLEALIEILKDAPAQLFITAIGQHVLPFDLPARVFHVERGRLSTLV